MPIRPRRSVLYMPGSNPRAIAKARSLPCDGVILDLEDAVAPEAKDAARAEVLRALSEGGFGRREVVVRINAPGSDWGRADLAALAGAGTDALLVPKVSDPGDLAPVQAALGAGNPTRIWAMMETPRAMLVAPVIAAAVRGDCPALSVLVMGTNDLAKDSRARPGPGRLHFLPWLMACVTAARAEGLDILDGVWNALDDPAGLAAECEQGRDLGMDGKTLIHPDQIAPSNAAFTPSPEEVAQAERIVAAFDRPENRGLGALRLEGRMVERLHAEMARRTLELAAAAALD
jgi:citrate lyase subunit beta / citryl-CoA lyase